MGQAMGDILPLALAVAISPIPIIAIVLTLGTPRARSNGIAFTLGWIAGLTIVGTVMLLVSSGNATQSSGAPGDLDERAQAALRRAVSRARGPLMARPAETGRGRGDAQVDGGDRHVHAGEDARPGRVSGLNPKNLALTVAAAATIAQADISGGQEAEALVVFILIGSLTILTPVVIYFAMGSKAKAILDELKGFMAAHNAAIMTVLFLVLGAKLIGEAISGFSS